VPCERHNSGLGIRSDARFILKAKFVVSTATVLTVWSSLALAQDGESVVAPSVGEAQSQVQQAVVDAEPTPNAEVDKADAEASLSAEELAAINASLVADAPVEAAAAAPATGGLSSANPDISLILDVAGAYFSDTPQMAGGHDPNHTGVTLQQLEMHIASSVDPFFKFDANIVFAQFGVEVEEAYFTTLALPASLQVRGGQFLTPFGRINPTHPHSWSFLNQPLVNGKFFGSEGSRGLGAEVSWLSPLPWYAEVVGSATEGVGECCARSFFGADDLGIETPSDLLYTTALKQYFPLSDDFSVMWGLSAQFGPNPTGKDNRSEIYGTDLYLRYRPVDATDMESLSLQVEAMARKRQIPNDVLTDAGGYADLVWRMSKTWEVGTRAEYVTGTENDYLDPTWTTARTRGSLQASLYPSHFSRIRLQGLADHPSDQDWYWGVMLGFEVLVGAHGAHAY